MKEPICIVKVLDYEAQTAKHKKVLKCEQCPIVEKCKERKDDNNGSSRL